MQYWIAAFFSSPFSLFFTATFIASLVVGWYLFLSHSKNILVRKIRGSAATRLFLFCLLLASAGASLYFATMATAWMHFFTVEKAPVELR